MTGFADILGATFMLCVAAYSAGLLKDWWKR